MDPWRGDRGARLPGACRNLHQHGTAPKKPPFFFFSPQFKCILQHQVLTSASHHQAGGVLFCFFLGGFGFFFSGGEGGVCTLPSPACDGAKFLFPQEVRIPPGLGAERGPRRIPPRSPVRGARRGRQGAPKARAASRRWIPLRPPPRPRSPGGGGGLIWRSQIKPAHPLFINPSRPYREISGRSDGSLLAFHLRGPPPPPVLLFLGCSCSCLLTFFLLL